MKGQLGGGVGRNVVLIGARGASEKNVTSALCCDLSSCAAV